MAKAKINKVERTIYCSGPNWEGDGSKAASACKLEHSMKTLAERYKCSDCTQKTKKTAPDKALERKKGSVADPVATPVATPVAPVAAPVAAPKTDPKPSKKKRKRRRF